VVVRFSAWPNLPVMLQEIAGSDATILAAVLSLPSVVQDRYQRSIIMRGITSIRRFKLNIIHSSEADIFWQLKLRFVNISILFLIR
jgi:hypothetical protein